MTITAFERSLQGTGASRRLRISGRTPGIVFGGTTAPQAIELDHNQLWHALQKGQIGAEPVELELAGQKFEVLLRDVQYHPYKAQVLHVDFQRVDENTKRLFKVAVNFVGAEESPAVKQDNCTITHLVTELEVSCVPAARIESVDVDLSGLKKGSSVYLRSVKLPQGVTPVTHGSQSNPPLVKVVAPVIVSAAPVADDDGKKKKKK